MFNVDTLIPNLTFNKPVEYNSKIILYPVKMENIYEFNLYKNVLTIRKDALFPEKEIIKMEYFQFIKFLCMNFDFAQKNKDKCDTKNYPFLYDYLINLLSIVCNDNKKIVFNTNTLDIYINGELLTNEIFEDLRRIIIIQNDIDFNPDEFINIDTLRSLEKAKAFENSKNDENQSIEDAVDSLVIALHLSEEYISNMSIRKFWRYIKRVNKFNDYQIYQTATASGMVTFKNPIKHWMSSIEIENKYANVTSSEEEIRSKLG